MPYRKFKRGNIYYKHRHSGPKVRYRTRRNNVRYRERPMHTMRNKPKKQFIKKSGLLFSSPSEASFREQPEGRQMFTHADIPEWRDEEGYIKEGWVRLRTDVNASLPDNMEILGDIIVDEDNAVKNPRVSVSEIYSKEDFDEHLENPTWKYGFRRGLREYLNRGGTEDTPLLLHDGSSIGTVGDWV